MSISIIIGMIAWIGGGIYATGIIYDRKRIVLAALLITPVIVGYLSSLAGCR